MVLDGHPALAFVLHLGTFWNNQCRNGSFECALLKSCGTSCRYNSRESARWNRWIDLKWICTLSALRLRTLVPKRSPVSRLVWDSNISKDCHLWTISACVRRTRCFHSKCAEFTDFHSLYDIKFTPSDSSEDFKSLETESGLINAPS